MVLQKLSQSLRITLALMVATFSSGLLQPAVAYATPASTPASQLDTDGDGVEDNKDACPETESGTVVDNKGCEETDDNATGGNNGTIKIHESTDPSGTESNNPKVCSFNVEGFGFDEGQTGYLVFTVQGGDGPTGTDAGPFEFGPADDEGFVETAYFNLEDGHYKATLYGKDTDGSLNDEDEKAKSKVFKVSCPQDEITTPEVVSVVVCGPENDTYSVVEGDNYSITDNEDGSFTLTADTGFVFEENGMTTLTVYGDEDTNTVCPPSVCTVSNNNYITAWTYGGYSNPDAGSYPEGGISGSYEFKSDGLYLNTPNVESYVSGLIGGGNTRLSDVDAMSYETLRLAQSAGYENTLPAYILEVDTNGTATAGGVTYMFYEPYYNGTVTEGTWQTWDAYDGGDAKWYISGTSQTLRTWDYFVTEFPQAVVLGYGFNQGTYNAETYSAVQDMTFDCATTTFGMTGGQGGGNGGGQVQGDTTVKIPVTTATTPQTLGAAVLPAVLPATGANDSPLMILAAALLAYGAAYFLQGRRLITRKEMIGA